jgi:hypothetical protein
VAIVAFWLAALGYSFYREVLPKLRTGEPPPFAIELVDEVNTVKRQNSWIIRQNGMDAYRVKTSVEYVAADDTFKLIAEYTKIDKNRRDKKDDKREQDKPPSTYHVTREGNLLDVQIALSATVTVRKKTVTVDAKLSGTVEDGQFKGTFPVDFPGFPGWEGKLEPVSVRAHGRVLFPLYPENKIHGLYPGRTWEVPLVDPITDALVAKLTGSVPPVHSLLARVLPEPETLTVGGKEVSCLVITYYEGDEYRGKTWVREGDGEVQRQEATLGDNQWVIQREDGTKQTAPTGRAPQP